MAKKKTAAEKEADLFAQLTWERKRLRVLEMRKTGLPQAEIAYRLNISAGQVSEMIREELETTRKLADQAVDDLRDLELARLDAATVYLWPRVEKGDTRAIEVLMKIMERRARLSGLDAPEKQVTMDLTESLNRLSPTELRAEAVRLGLPVPPENDEIILLPLPGEQIKVPKYAEAEKKEEPPGEPEPL